MRPIPRDYILALVVFTGIVIGGVSLMSIIFDSGVELNEAEKVHFQDFNKSMNKLADLNNTVSGWQTNLESGDTDPGIFGVLNSLISQSWQSLRLVVQSFSFMNDAFSVSSRTFGIPSWMVTLATLAITIMLVFAVWSAIFQREL